MVHDWLKSIKITGEEKAKKKTTLSNRMIFFSFFSFFFEQKEWEVYWIVQIDSLNQEIWIKLV